MAIKKADLDREISKAVTQLQEDMEEWKLKFEEQTKHEISLMAEELKKQHHSEMELLKNKMLFDMEIKCATISESFKAKVELLTDLNKSKNDEINKLNREIGELQASVNITGDDIAKIQKDNSTMSENICNAQQNIQYVHEKAADLEDRSKRNNLLFKGFVEKEGETNEDCETMIRKFISEKKLLTGSVGGDSFIKLDRVHRIGRKRDDGKPRSIVCRLTYYKDKEQILYNGKLLKGSGVSMSEQYSRLTSDINSKIYKACKTAKEKDSTIKRFYVKYRFATVHYESGQKKFRKNYDLRKIEAAENWYKVHF